jgi:hypothetical protein
MSEPLRQTVQVKGRMKPDTARGLPEASLDFTLLLEKKRGKVVAKVAAAYLTLTDRTLGVARTISCNDGRAALDLNAHGKVVGIELLSGQGPFFLAEFARHVNATKDPVVISGANTLTLAWPQVAVLANVALELIREERRRQGLAVVESVAVEAGLPGQFKKELEGRVRRELVPAA